MGIGITESIFLIAVVVSTIWVFFDAPKVGINKYIAALVTLLLIYPIGFIAYLIVSRIRKRRLQLS